MMFTLLKNGWISRFSSFLTKYSRDGDCSDYGQWSHTTMTKPYALILGLLLMSIVPASCASAPVSSDTPSESLRHLNALLQDSGSALQFSEGYITLDGTRLHYVAGGSGKLVVFYHGFPAYWYTWTHQLRDLAKDYRVVALDGLGAGLSDKPTEVAPYKLSNLTRQLQQFIETFAGQENYVLVGHDWGGALAWAYAQQNPKGLEKLIVFNAPPPNLLLELLQSNPEQRQSSIYIERLKQSAQDNALDEIAAHNIWESGYRKLSNRGVLTEAEAILFKNALAQPGALLGGANWYRANIPSPDAITEADFWPSRSASTSVESLLIWGEADRTFAPVFMEQLPRYAKKLRIEKLPGINHSPMLEVPEKVNKLMRDFIETP